VQQEQQVPRAQLEILVRKVLLVHKALLGRQDQLVTLDHKALSATRDPQVLRVRLVQQGQLVLKEPKDQLDLLVPMAPTVQQDRLDLLVPQVLQAQ